MEESDPGGHVASVHALLVCALHHEVECLGEPEQEDDVDDGEGEHVARDHGEDHCHEWSRQLDGSAVGGRQCHSDDDEHNETHPAKNMR